MNMNIAIIGAGNLGTALACDLGRKNRVRIYSTKPHLFNRNLLWKDTDDSSEWKSNIEFASNSYQEVVLEADIVFFTLPTFLIKDAVHNVLPFLRDDALLGFIPGAGGVEYLSYEAIKKGYTIFGFERVPYIARVEKYGESVFASKKPHYRVAALPASKSAEVSDIMEKMFERPCAPMQEFISMTLTPSLHTSRLYDLYKDYTLGEKLTENPYFYGEWRDSASLLTFEMDRELHQVCDELTRLGISTKEVVPYPVHYESDTPEKFTKKLRSINSLKMIKGPLKAVGDGKYELDIDSRYFTESYPYRLCIVKGIADLIGLKVPKTDEVLRWYEKLSNKEYFNDNVFNGKDIIECNIPQNYGVHNIAELKEIYQ